MPAASFQDDFESGLNANGWNGAVSSVSTPVTATYGVVTDPLNQFGRSLLLNDNDGNIVTVSKPLSSLKTGNFSVMLRFRYTNPASANQMNIALYGKDSGGSARSAVRFYTNGTAFKVYDSSTGRELAAVNPDWHDLLIEANISTRTFVLALDGVKYGPYSFYQSGIIGIDEIRFYSNSVGMNQLYVDEVKTFDQYRLIADHAPKWTSGSLTASMSGEDRVSLSWPQAEDDLGIVKYTLYENGSAVVASIPGNVTTYQINGLAEGETKTFTVKATNRAGNESAAGLSAIVGPFGGTGTVLPYSKENFHIYVLLGQSNMSGRAEIEMQDQTVLEHTYLLTTNNTWENATAPLNRYSTSEYWTPGGSTRPQLNPGYTFAKKIAETNPEIGIGLVSNARGGTSIDWWAKNYIGPIDGKDLDGQPWQPGSPNLYARALERIREAQKYGTIKGILWHQGESNRSDAQYMTKLTQLINDLRADIGDPDLSFVAGQVFNGPGAYSTSSIINETLADLPEVVANTDFVSSAGTTVKDVTTHFDSAGQRLLGYRYADKINRMVYHRTVDVTAPQPPGDFRITDDTGGTVSLAWDAATDDVGVMGYQIYLNGSKTPIRMTAATNAAITGLNAGAANTFTIAAFDAAGNLSAESTAREGIKPSAPAGLTTTAKTRSSVSLSWTASTDNAAVARYAIYVNGGTEPVLNSETVGATIAGLEQGMTYTFTVKAIDNSGNLSDASQPLEVTTDAFALGDLQISGIRLAFDPGVLKYAVTVTNDVYSLNVTASVYTSEPMTLTLNGQTIESDVPSVWHLQPGVNAASIVLSDAMGEEKEYTVTITRLGKPVIGLEAPDSIYTGQPFLVTLGISHVDYPLLAEEVAVTFDPNRLELVSVQPARAGLIVYPIATEAAGMVRSIVASDGSGEAVTQNSALLVYSFKAKGVAGATDLTVPYFIAASAQGAEAAAEPTLTTVQIKP